MTMNKIKKKNDGFMPSITNDLKVNYRTDLVFKTYFKENLENHILEKKKHNLINSAVLCLISNLEEKHDTNIILTLRSKKLRKHSGQISFPGGKLELNDKDFESCALRETFEEIGVSFENIEILGKMNKYSTGTGFLIQPIIAKIKKDIEFKVNPNEVDEVIYFPIEYLFSKKNIELSTYKSSSNEKYLYYDIDWNNYRIWGATAMILFDLSKVIKKYRNNND